MADRAESLAADLRDRALVFVDLAAELGAVAAEIADVLHVTHKTVQNDLAGCDYSQPDRVIGKDGKSYPARKPPKLPEDLTPLTTRASAERAAEELTGK
jgi:hypothetical protein